MSPRASLPSPNFRGKKGGRKSRGGGGAPGPAGGNYPFGVLLLGILLGGGGVWFYEHRDLFRPGNVASAARPAVEPRVDPRHTAMQAPEIKPPQSAPPLEAPPKNNPVTPAIKPRSVARHAVANPAGSAQSPPLVSLAPIRPKVAIVMDDAGASLQQIQPLGLLDARLTLAVIPHLRDSVSVADYWHGRGREVILHLPMEADNDAAHAAGSGVLRPGMAAGVVRDTVLRNVAAVPHLKGVNNHMGSRATSDPRLMRDFLEALKPSGLYFLDSRTSGSSVAYATARQLGIRAAMRNGAFLDNEPRSPAAIQAALRTLLQQARAQGSAIGIGHVTSPDTIAVLNRELPGLALEYDFVYASELTQ